ncbi:hypothetical protein BofuT4_P154860.1 [Botrytis cinerea T4]|uniref:Uncharacterized protein n=1 Tax=Botryotinia fuckeliana (strain T4) TaxID=999810 RepID=G2YVM6_BOTF4|nr:hypothetical protein BofuT4_P154860.1 [Botrytis cinerea T4]
MAHSPQSTLTTLHKLQKSHELSIIKLSEPVSAPLKSGSRTSNASAADTLENPSPASLEADLAHYKKLRAQRAMGVWGLASIKHSILMTRSAGHPRVLELADEGYEGRCLDYQCMMD